ncbi:mucin-5AC [Folsomia candida]|uniref:mucin-5AC n=1 Tax=Folsomia candida TaxID=158441 RepID=UPI001604D48F|nr:mucin-5AC [Folsomia candida]
MGHFNVKVVALLLFLFTLSDSKVLQCDGEPELTDCPSWEEGVPTYLPFPYDCRKFIVCTNGYPIVQCCPPSTVWNQDLLVCDHESWTPCVIVTTPPTPDLTSPTTAESQSPPTTTPTTSTPTTTIPTTTAPTTTIPTTAATTTSIPTTAATTTSIPTTVATTTSIPTTAATTTSIPTTAATTTSIPTTTTPTTTTRPTSTSPTTTTRPTTTNPTTTTRPTTTTPTTTTRLTTTTRPTTTQQPDPIHGASTIFNSATGMAFSVYKHIVNDGNQIHAIPHVSNCSDLSQVWKLELNVTHGYYIIRSALGTGSQQWSSGLHCSSRLFPYIFKFRDPHYTDAFWSLTQVPGTTSHTIYQTSSGRTGNIRYTGVANDIGVDLEIIPTPNSNDHAQRWVINACPSNHEYES